MVLCRSSSYSKHCFLSPPITQTCIGSLASPQVEGGTVSWNEGPWKVSYIGELTTLLEGKHTTRCKWVFTLKYNSFFKVSDGILWTILIKKKRCVYCEQYNKITTKLRDTFSRVMGPTIKQSTWKSRSTKRAYKKAKHVFGSVCQNIKIFF